MERDPAPKDAPNSVSHPEHSMLSSFRNLSKSKFGTLVMAIILIGIVAGFALADAQNFGTGSMGFGMGSDSLAEVGGRKVSEREVSDAMQRRLQEARQQNPSATYASIAGDFDVILDAMIDQAALIAFAEKNGFNVSKRLIDAEIAQLPGTKGLNGQFSDDAYKAFLAQRGLTDGEVRNVITGGILQRLMLTPVAVNARIPVGLATPYASMLLEARSGQAAVLPIDAFVAGLKPSDAQLQQYYLKNRARYTIPEQRTPQARRDQRGQPRRSQPPATRKSPTITTPIRRPMAAPRPAI